MSRKMALAFLQGFHTSAGETSKAYLRGMLTAEERRLRKEQSDRDERRLGIMEEQAGREADLFPLQFEGAQLDLKERAMGLQTKRAALRESLDEAEHAAKKRDYETLQRQNMEGAITELSQLLVEDEDKILTRGEVALIAGKYKVPMKAMEDHLGELLRGSPKPTFAPAGSQPMVVDPVTGIPSPVGEQIPFAPRGAGGRASAATPFEQRFGMSAAEMNALINMGEYAQGGKLTSPMESFAMSKMAERDTIMQGILSRQQAAVDRTLQVSVNNELRNLFNPEFRPLELNYDFDPDTGEGLLYNPASGDTLFGGR